MSNLLTMEEHFARAIDANPHDMETRQAHVDWLEEQGRLEEAKVWWSVRDRVPRKVLNSNGSLMKGWFPEGTTERFKYWEKKCPLAVIPDVLFELLTDEEKNTYSPFLNLSALVREMMKQHGKEATT